MTDVRDFLGHRDVSQTNTYLASTPLRLREALARRDAARTNLAQSPEGDPKGSLSGRLDPNSGFNPAFEIDTARAGR